MGVTAAQFVWEPEGEADEAAPGPGPHESSTSSAAPPHADAHYPPEGEESATTTGKRKRIRRKTTESQNRRRAPLRGFHLRRNALGEDLCLLLFLFHSFAAVWRPVLGEVSVHKWGSMAACTFHFRFREQCNSDPVLVEGKGPKMPDRALCCLT